MFDERYFYKALCTFPELKMELAKLPDAKSSYHLARCLADFIEHSVDDRNFSACSKCLSLAESALRKGNGPMRNAIRFVFMPVILQIIKYDKAIVEQIPPSLRLELNYMQQHSY